MDGRTCLPVSSIAVVGSENNQEANARHQHADSVGVGHVIYISRVGGVSVIVVDVMQREIDGHAE
jgi:hypothetical protein